MPLEGYATVEGTKRYGERMVASGVAQREHFREGLGGLTLSSIGHGTYLGGHDDRTDGLYLAAVKQAIASGCNVFDSAINYRCQRSERVIGLAMAELIRESVVRRDELVIATKGGFIPYDGAPPRDSHAYIQNTFVMPGVISSTDVVADCHCMTPAYLRHQIVQSLKNLQVDCIDLYYLHNPEGQRAMVGEAEFRARLREAMERHGFAVYAPEWWHFTLRREPYPDSYLDLLVR